MTKLIDILINRKSINYSIDIDENNLEKLPLLIKSKLHLVPPYPKLFLLTHHNLNSLYGNKIVKKLNEEGFEIFTELVNNGESVKSWKNAEKLLTRMIENKLGRNAIVIALGGGVIGDLAGFISAIYNRGIDFIQIPTTLLSMVDSSVGGKTGVNLGLSGKNLVGAFHQPKMVLVDLSTLTTLPDIEWKHGLSEVIKYSLLKNDNGNFYKWLQDNKASIITKSNIKAMEYMIGECIQTKANIVSKDEYETGGHRILLNLGHTFGHSLEAASRYRIAHGEAVAMGISLAARLAVKINKIDKNLCNQILNILKSYDLPNHIDIHYSFSPYELIRHFEYDKKNQGSTIRFVVPSRTIGRCEVVQDIPQEILVDVFSEAIY
ncbi:MAG: 3-dehydroquinate synthase [Candidatus Caenarcaniphilales bacterium]|nr:3-dehydroquinate synthase [Candidatus Caenarcaniphilales bacterium]